MVDINKKFDKLIARKIVLQGDFKEYNDSNGFSYEEWINPPSGHFYEGYKKEIAEIDNKMSPPLTYQS